MRARRRHGDPRTQRPRDRPATQDRGCRRGRARGARDLPGPCRASGRGRRARREGCTSANALAQAQARAQEQRRSQDGVQACAQGDGGATRGSFARSCGPPRAVGDFHGLISARDLGSPLRCQGAARVFSLRSPLASASACDGSSPLGACGVTRVMRRALGINHVGLEKMDIATEIETVPSSGLVTKPPSATAAMKTLRPSSERPRIDRESPGI
jgi:hypothetical protein